jgi:ureidoacrylate peracid hydrolase
MHSLSRVDPNEAAVVVIDVQNDFCDPEGLQARQGKDVSAAREMVPVLTRFVARARQVGLPVVVVRTTHGNSTDTPEWLARHDDPDRAQSCQKDSWGAEYYAVEPRPGDLVVEKHRYNAFTGTNLESSLRALGRRSLLFCGVTTNTCVESSLREAVCRDFLATLVADCCASYTPRAHERALASVGEGFGLVTRSEPIITYWESGARRSSES